MGERVTLPNILSRKLKSPMVVSPIELQYGQSSAASRKQKLRAVETMLLLNELSN